MTERVCRMVEVTVWGGAGEIGGNKVLVDDGRTRILLDFGMSFARHQDYYDDFLKPRPVLDDLLRLGILPPIHGIYREDLVRPGNWRDAAAAGGCPETFWTSRVKTAAEHRAAHGRAGVDAVVLTHAHADHLNHVAYLDPAIPVYCSAVTRTLARAISDVSKGGVENEFWEATERAFARSKEESKQATFPGSWTLDRNSATVARPFLAKDELVPFEIGTLTVTLVPVDHSVPGACAVHVRTRDGKSVFYTGDIRFHGNLTERQAALRKYTEGLRPDLLLCEGTRIDSKEGDSEATVEAAMSETVRGTRGLSIVEFAWKDTTRFDTMQRVAARSGRTLVVSPKLAYLLRALREEVGAPFRRLREYEDVRCYLDRRGSLTYSKADYSNAKFAAGEAADWGKTREPEWSVKEREAFLCHYEGGVRAADIREHPERYVVSLSFFEMSDLFDLDPPAGSTYARCQCEPFNDEMKLDQRKQENWLRAFGLNADAGGALLTAHASGHAGRKDIEAFVRWTEPARVLPIHTVKPKVFEEFADAVVPWGARPTDPVVVRV